MFGHLGFLANAVNAYGYLCYVIFATELNDVAAFTFGRIFGRHPLRSEISPKKTWEGALGALAVSMILPWLLRFSFPEFGPRAVDPGRIDCWHRWAAGRSFDQRDQARHRNQRHGRVDSRATAAFSIGSTV